jgi:diguanylate cyclase (GGDEF)-like protein
MQRGQEITEELTGSVISFIHFVNSDENSIELVTWSKRTLKDYCNAVYDSHYPIRQAGIWADALRQHQPVVFNDYASYSGKHGLPEGHAPLVRLISVPVIEGGKVVMLAGVGNKPEDYDNEDVESVQLIANDIWRLVQRRRMLKQLETIAHYDALTNLPNRVVLADRIQMALAQSRRSGKLVAVAYLDLDGFKEVNDRFGHDAGDHLLVELAGKMHAGLREVDTVARLGGDEFIIVLPDLDSKPAALPELNRLLTAVSQPVPYRDDLLHVSGSIGVTFFPQRTKTDGDLLLRQADHAMYQAKLLGRNRVSFFDSAQEQDIGGQNIKLKRMWQGLDAGEFLFHYQPKINMRTGKLVGVEALIRWQHPEQGLLAPGTFLHHAENDKIMVAFGKLAIGANLRLQERWHGRSIQVPVSVNIDALHLQLIDLLNELLNSTQDKKA